MVQTMEENQKFIKELINGNEELFKDELGCLKVAPVRILLKKGAQPVQLEARQLPYACKEEAKAAFQKQVKRGVFTPTTLNTTCRSPTVFVQKPNGNGKRVCVDYSRLNGRLEEYEVPMPRIEELFNKLNGKSWFTSIDLADAYSQVMVDEETRSVLAVTTPDGLYLCNRLPNGVKPAPAIFQGTMALKSF
uniref:Reverse transcriptase domain-containing protein n=1 Tax=Panagrolaimus sp. JU765 TaxID=591449 RepID=A0AC34Q0K3_9BILA